MHYSGSDNKADNMDDLTEFPLLHYAAKLWYHHSSLHECSDVSSELKLLEANAARRSWLNVHTPDMRWKSPFMEYVADGSNLHYCIYMGLETVVRSLVEKGAIVNAERGRYGSALQVATERGCIEVVKLLLEKGANLNTKGRSFNNALQTASVKGHIEVAAGEEWRS